MALRLAQRGLALLFQLVLTIHGICDVWMWVAVFAASLFTGADATVDVTVSRAAELRKTASIFQLAMRKSDRRQTHQLHDMKHRAHFSTVSDVQKCTELTVQNLQSIALYR